MSNRDYKSEYRQYHARPEQKKRRAGRNAARRYMVKQGRVKKGDNKDVDHRDFNARNNDPANLSVKPRSANRARKPRSYG